jgi:hypothetical protein
LSAPAFFLCACRLIQSLRVRTGYAANNLAIVRHIVMNLLRLNTTRKASIKSKRMLAATIDEFRAELLGVMT